MTGISPSVGNDRSMAALAALNPMYEGFTSTTALLRQRPAKGNELMSIIAWLVLGLIAGFIASKLYAGSGQGIVLDMVLGIVGAFVGGFLFSTFGAAPVTGFNIYSMIVAIVGAIVVLWIYHAVVGRRAM